MKEGKVGISSLYPNMPFMKLLKEIFQFRKNTAKIEKTGNV
jgi:hypothetical protein